MKIKRLVQVFAVSRSNTEISDISVFAVSRSAPHSSRVHDSDGVSDESMISTATRRGRGVRGAIGTVFYTKK